MKNFFITLIFVFTIFFCGCSKKEEDTIIDVLPTLKTLTVNNITTNSATLGGQITNASNVAVSQRGIVWSNSPNPNLNTNSLNIESGNASFSATINNLIPNSTYYVKAYLQTIKGVIYGDEVSFQTINSTLANVVTGAISSDQINSLLVSAEVNSTTPVGTRGICYSTTPNPTPSTISGAGVGTFQARIFTNPGTTYYIRAYAQNAAGTSYGNEVVYNTISSFFTQSTDLSDIDGNTYPTFTINNQRWTQKNLNVSRFRNGDIIPHIQDGVTWINTTTPAWCYYENNTANGIIYGKLYNHYAVTDPRGLAPIGWHIPTVLETRNLIFYMGANVNNVPLDQSLDFTSVSETFRAVGSTYWQPPNANATNSSGFTALPGGYRYKQLSQNGGFVPTFERINRYGKFWCADLVNDVSGNFPNHARDYRIEYDPQIVSISIIGKNYRTTGASVRCVKD